MLRGRGHIAGYHCYRRRTKNHERCRRPGREVEEADLLALLALLSLLANLARSEEEPWEEHPSHTVRVESKKCCCHPKIGHERAAREPRDERHALEGRRGGKGSRRRPKASVAELDKTLDDCEATNVDEVESERTGLGQPRRRRWKKGGEVRLCGKESFDDEGGSVDEAAGWRVD